MEFIPDNSTGVWHDADEGNAISLSIFLFNDSDKSIGGNEPGPRPGLVILKI